MADRDDENPTFEFSGADTGSVVQAGSLHGGIHYHGPPGRAFPPPRQLPPATGKFVDRAANLDQLDLLLATPNDVEAHPRTAPVIVAITGAPGVGKTALALHWAHRVRDRFMDGDLYIDMRGYGSVAPLSTEQALDSFLRSLNVDPDRIPIDLAERAALYRSLLGRMNILIVIDNVASVRQVRYLLPGSHRCLALVTSRSRLSSLITLEGATRVNLDVLSQDDAVRLIAEFVGEERIEEDHAAANQVAALCSYLPLALRVVAERAAARPFMPLRELALELTSEQNRLDALASEEDELANVRVVFSWSYRALLPDQQKVFRLMGLHPGMEFGTAVAGALVDATPPVVEPQLRALANVHLVQEVAAGRFRLHDLLRAYSTERIQREVPQRERTYAVRRMFVWYLHAADIARRTILPYSHAIPLVPSEGYPVPSFGSVQAAMNWYEEERLNILAVIQQAMDLGQYDIAWKLPVVADGYFELRSYWTEWKQIHIDGLLAARTLGDRLGEASNLFCLGDANWRVGELEEALEFYQRSAEIADTMADHWLAGFSTRGIGLIHQEKGDLNQALDHFAKALEIFRTSGLQRGEGMSLVSLGKVHLELEQFERAVEYCADAVAIFARIEDSWSRAWGLISLSEAVAETGRPDMAEQYARDAVTTFQSFADLRSEALALSALGSIVAKRGDSAGARECWTRALEMFDQLEDGQGAARVSARMAALDTE